jgi:hypothetical protein
MHDVIFALISKLRLLIQILNPLKSEAITEIHMNKDLSQIRIQKLFTADGKRKTLYAKRENIIQVKFDRVQAMQPLYVRIEDEEHLIGHFPITDKVEISNTLAFELLFGPSAYNTFQYFQVRIK